MFQVVIAVEVSVSSSYCSPGNIAVLGKKNICTTYLNLLEIDKWIYMKGRNVVYPFFYNFIYYIYKQE